MNFLNTNTKFEPKLLDSAEHVPLSIYQGKQIGENEIIKWIFYGETVFEA